MNQDNNSAKVFLTVNTFDDQNDGSASNGLSLRDAVLIAQRDPGREYVIDLPQGTYNLTIQGNEDLRFQEVGSSPENVGLFDRFVGRTGDLDISTRVTIVGDSAANTIIDASTLGDRILDVKQGGFLTLDNVTVQNGRVTGTFLEPNNDPLDPDSFSGGGIRILDGGGGEINNSVIKGNRTLWDGITDEATINGGGIDNRGQLEINNSTIIDNVADANAGGIYNAGALEINNSSIVNNLADISIFYVDQPEGGGGIQNSADGTLLLKNSTVGGNSATLSGNDDRIFPEGAGGGGILSDGGEVVIINSTIVDNSAPIGSGILISEPSLEDVVPIPATLQNSIVAQNTNIIGSNILAGQDIEGIISLDSSYNLIGIGGVLFDGVENNITGDTFNPLDPLLGPLQFNGGLTPTYSPLPDSPVINVGSNAIATQRTLDTAPLVEDQTGNSRIINSTVDIGSVEFDPNQGNGNVNTSLNNPVYRFQNSNVPGTYLFVNQIERQSVLTDNPEFEEEGLAFNVSLTPGDDLVALYRLQNEEVPGTYLYATEGEKNQILSDTNNNFELEGVAFYVYGADANIGQDIYRFQNKDRQGTYLFANAQEKQNILANFANFELEGVAFEV